MRHFQKADIDPFYVIIGYLGEYFGGYSLDEETVDMFFVNESEKAEIFHCICLHYLKSLKTESDIQLIKTNTGHSFIQSRIICKKLMEQFTIQEPDFLTHKCYKLAAENDLFKSAEELYGNKEKLYNFKRYSYLLGVVIRNKLEDRPAINFANAGHKADLAITILREFSNLGDEPIKVEYFFNVPHVTRITLSEKNPIWKEIEKFKKLIKFSGKSAKEE